MPTYAAGTVSDHGVSMHVQVRSRLSCWEQQLRSALWESWTPKNGWFAALGWMLGPSL